MNKVILLVLISFVPLLAAGQVNEGLIELGKAYRQFMFRNDPAENVQKALDKFDNTELANAADFILEAIRPGNSVLSDKYLMRPQDKDLKLIYIIREINLNVREENPKDNNKLIESLSEKKIDIRELIDNYYSMLFIAHGNKVKPFDLSQIDFQLNTYGLKDDTERGIFFLQSMRSIGSEIFGYMNIVKPPNYAKAREYINKFPKYNSGPYYQFLDLNFPDFKINWDSKRQSYKEVYIDKYYETLLSHLACLREAGDKERVYDLMIGSILKEKIYYKYSKREKELEQLFTEFKK